MQADMCVGVLVAAHHTFGRDVIRGVVEYCRERGPWDIHVEGAYSELSLRQVCKVICHWAERGLIAEFWWPEQFRAMRRQSFPAVEVSGIWHFPGVVQVIPDHQAAGRLVAQHFLQRGLRHFGSYGLTRFYSVREREIGFAEALRQAGRGFQRYHDRKFKGKSQDPAADRQALASWLTRLKKPVGLLCAGDHRAREAVLACRIGGLNVPEEVSIVGVGNDELICEVSGFPISSVGLAGARIGYIAAELIDRMRRGREPPREPILVPPTGIITRRSSDILAAENAEVAAAIRYIQEHAVEDIDVRDVLRHVPISRRALERNLRRLLGRSPQGQIMHVRAELAQRMLAESDLPMSEVARRCGFSGQATFTIIFKRLTRMTPTMYRRQFRIGTAGA